MGDLLQFPKVEPKEAVNGPSPVQAMADAYECYARDVADADAGLAIPRMTYSWWFRGYRSRFIRGGDCG